MACDKACSVWMLSVPHSTRTRADLQSRTSAFIGCHQAAANRTETFHTPVWVLSDLTLIDRSENLAGELQTLSTIVDYLGSC